MARGTQKGGNKMTRKEKMITVVNETVLPQIEGATGEHADLLRGAIDALLNLPEKSVIFSDCPDYNDAVQTLTMIAKNGNKIHESWK
jgi:hypothetical protein